MKFIVGKRLPKIDPVIKLVPIMKLRGNLIVSLIKKLTLFLLELFCIPTISIKNREELKKIFTITFFIDTKMLTVVLIYFSTNYR